jgi:hypothetical protein
MRMSFSDAMETLIGLTPGILLVTLHAQEILVRLKEVETIPTAYGSLNETNRGLKVAKFQNKPHARLPDRPGNPGDRCSGTIP